jgi:MFS superfamily sulfate permease-like transporter
MFKELSPNDVKSGFLVFLIALPLCLGISVASSTPPIAGILTAIIGGLFVSFFGSAPLTIKGPAAGLIVVILDCVQELGKGDPMLGYKRCLAVGFAAALIQIILSRAGAGRIGQFIPPSVVHGMLAAIGVIIMAKQIHILLGVTPQGKSPFQLVFEIPGSFTKLNPLITFIGMLTLVIFLCWPLLKMPTAKKIPPALLSLSIVLPLAVLFHIDSLHTYTAFNSVYEIGPKFLVNLPDNIFSSIVFPDFAVLGTLVAWKHVLLLAIIASIESLLTVAAVSSLDPQKRVTDPNKDLFAQGVGNLITSAIGGLPMISEAVRSKANIDNGAQSQWSNFFHGAFLLISILFFTNVIHEIPLAALAAMLILTGFRLASPKEFHRTYKIGRDQLLLFATALTVTLATDLLVGVLSGLVLKIVLHVFRGAGMRHLFKMPISTSTLDDTIVLKVAGCAIFTNFASLSRQIEKARASNLKVVVDLSGASLVDHTTLNRLHQMIGALGKDCFRIVGLESLKGVSSHEHSTRRFQPQQQQA